MAAQGRWNFFRCSGCPDGLVQWWCPTAHWCNAAWQKRAFGFYETNSKIHLYCWRCCAYYPVHLNIVTAARQEAKKWVCDDCYRTGGRWIDRLQQLVTQEIENEPPAFLPPAHLLPLPTELAPVPRPPAHVPPEQPQLPPAPLLRAPITFS